MVAKKSVEAAVGRIRELPTLPVVLGRVLSIAADPEASALELGQVITTDQSLSAALLRVVNSAYYGFYRRIESVTQAIVVLGFFEVRNLTLTATAFRTLAAENSAYDRRQLWRHALAAGMAAERCAYLAGKKISGCFEAGLLHDIGKVAFDMLYGAQFVQAANSAHEQGVPIRTIEARTFGMDHAYAGVILGDHWILPPSVVEAIRPHHRPECATEDPALCAVAAVANCLTYSCGFGESSNPIPPELPTHAAKYLELTEVHYAQLVQELSGDEEKIDNILGALEG